SGPRHRACRGPRAIRRPDELGDPGQAASVAWSFVFERVDSVARHAVEVYEGITYLVLCVALLTIGRRYALPEGCLSALFLAAGMNTGQVLSIPLVIIGVATLVACGRRRPGARADSTGARAAMASPSSSTTVRPRGRRSPGARGRR